MAATDYFQTVPVSKLIMASYNDVEFTRTIVNKTYDRDGDANTKNDRYVAARVYDEATDKHSDTQGSVYSGDMRENVGKSQVSVGINMANFGVTSWDLTQRYPQPFKLITNHHAVGMYQCIGEENCPAEGYWRVEHGLSGGNGIGTIIATQGNEASHEWGHAYGLGHWPGAGLTSDCRWSDHNPMTGWGFIAFRDRLRNSVYGIANAGDTREMCTPGHANKVYSKGDYKFSRDAMSGGNGGGSPLSKYTFYTSFSARLIQQDLDKFAIPDASFASGYKLWDTAIGDYVISRPQIEGKPAPVATEVGVPVVTILGGYDPDDSAYTTLTGTAPDPTKRAVIYPAIYSNYGNLFELAAPSSDTAVDACWVDVENTAGRHQLVAVLPYRHNSGSINQLHFNLKASFKPSQASLYCRHAGVTQLLTSTSMDTTIPALPPLAIVGQDHGFKQLQDREMQEISAGIMALAPDHIFSADSNLLLKIDSYSKADLQNGVSAAAWPYLQKLLSVQQGADLLSAQINYSRVVGLSQTDIKQALEQYLQDTLLLSAPDKLALAGAPITGSGGYIDTKLSSGMVKVPGGAAPADANWVLDSQGKLHIAAQPDQCLTRVGGYNSLLSIAACQSNSSDQTWDYDASLKRLKATNSNLCIDRFGSKGAIGLYSCTGNGNQQWSGIVQSNEPWLAFLNADMITLIRHQLDL